MADPTEENARWRSLLAMAQNDLLLSRAHSLEYARPFAESALDKLQLAMKALGIQPVDRWWEG